MITIVIVLITAAVSILCFSRPGMFEKLKFSAYAVWHRREWHRMITYGVVHGGWGHLLFNMITLYCFGRIVEQYFGAAFGATTGARSTVSSSRSSSAPTSSPTSSRSCSDS